MYPRWKWNPRVVVHRGVHPVRRPLQAATLAGRLRHRTPIPAQAHPVHPAAVAVAGVAVATDALALQAYLRGCVHGVRPHYSCTMNA